jgi:uncharacterized protein (DUF927 family)
MEKKRRKSEDKVNQGSVAAPPDEKIQTTQNDKNIIARHRENASPINLLKQRGFSEDAAYDLIASGLSTEIIEEAGIQPAIDEEVIKKYHIPIVDRRAHTKKFIPLYVIPYPIVDILDKDRMVRVKVKPNPLYLQTDPKIKDTKYLQPSKEHLKYGSHLYILPSELQKLQSPKCNLILVEGEKKALKVVQELRKIENQLGKYAVIGIAGINNWLNAPEWSLFNIRGKKVIIFFDADSEKNTAVVEAELQLTGYLYFQGASQILSARWNIQKGKGIDDYLTQEPNPSEALKNLLENAQDTIASYRGRIQDRDVAKNFFLRIFEKKYNITEASLENLSVILEDVGIKKTVIKSAIKIAKTEIEEKLIEKHKEKIKEVFGIENIEVPDGFLWEEGFLKIKKTGKIITEFFIVQSIVESLNEVEGAKIKTITGKEFILYNNEKEIKQLFQSHGVWVGDTTVSLISEYVKEYIYKNQANIKREKHAKQIGWHEDKEGNLLYIAPQTTQGYTFEKTLSGYTASGDKEKEKETLIKILRNGTILGIGYLGAIASLLIRPLEDVGARNFIVFLEGTAGSGKTTTGKLGLSLFGNPSKLLTNMNTTSTGAEILFSSRKDSLVILDEINTGGYHISEHLLKLIYDFENGIGRTRGTTKITLREHLTYRGVLFFTSETSFSNLIQKSEKTVFGAYRRSVIINYSNKKIDQQDIEIIYQSIMQHHGNLLKDITDYISDNIDFLKERYLHHRKGLSKPVYRFKGQENHFALMYCAIDVLEAVLGIDLSTEKGTITDTLGKIVQENSEDYKEATEITREKLESYIQVFIQMHNSYFPTGMESYIPQSIYGKKDGNTLYLTQLGLQAFSNEFKIDIKSLKTLLIEFGMAEQGEDRLLKKTRFSVAGKTFNAFKIQLSDDATEENQDNQKSIDI